MDILFFKEFVFPEILWVFTLNVGMFREKKLSSKLIPRAEIRKSINISSCILDSFPCGYLRCILVYELLQ